uniref:Uncharacterized protein n=1 Tax=Nothobranchius furzeri TaxID=105023 RepID=A0A8C6MKF8_NOTFU
GNKSRPLFQSDTKERALREMMDGVIEKQKKDIFKVEICQPEFVLTKPDADWTEEEKQRYKEHEEKIRETNQQKEKYRQKFLFTAGSSPFEFKQELKLQHERTLAHKVGEMFDGCDLMPSLSLQAFEKDFKKEFKDVSHHLVDVLYKLFKHRPRFGILSTASCLRVQQMRAQTENREPLPSPVQMQTAMEELDAPGNMPKGLKPSVWRRFCQMRRKKVETELKRNKHPLNGAVLVRLKQGQVVSPFNRTADSTGTDFILCHRSVRDSKRHTITVRIDPISLLSFSIDYI